VKPSLRETEYFFVNLTNFTSAISLLLVRKYLRIFHTGMLALWPFQVLFCSQKVAMSRQVDASTYTIESPQTVDKVFVTRVGHWPKSDEAISNEEP
jgi:hypothetical protein